MSARTFGPLVLVLLLLTACGGGGGGSSSDADRQRITMSLDDFELGTDGNGKISGMIPLPASVAADTRLQLTVMRTAPEELTARASGHLRYATTSIAYLITDLPAGTYSVRLRLDVTGNEMYGDPGDLEGWFEGTTDTPIFEAVDADERELADEEAIILNFGVGTVSEPPSPPPAAEG